RRPHRVPDAQEGRALARLRRHHRGREPGVELPHAVQQDHPDLVVRRAGEEDEVTAGGDGLVRRLGAARLSGRAVTAIILVAGVARRLAPLTDATHKALLPVGGRPILARMLDALAWAGVRRAALVVGHCADQVRALAGARVGFFKCGAEAGPAFVRFLERVLEENQGMNEYEDALHMLVTSHHVGWVDVTGLRWTEIDFAEDLRRAEADVLPHVVRLDGA